MDKECSNCKYYSENDSKYKDCECQHDYIKGCRNVMPICIWHGYRYWEPKSGDE